MNIPRINDELDMELPLRMALESRNPLDCAIVTMPKMSFWNNPDKTPEQKQHIIDRANTMQNGIRLPYEQKQDAARKVIKQALEQDVRWALSYSGGGDSTVLSHFMVEKLGLRHIPHVMSNTRMEYPETLQMFKKWRAWLAERGVECHQVFPDERPNVLWKRIGVPLWSKQLAYKYRKFSLSPSDKIPSHVPEEMHAQFRAAKKAGLKITEECCDYLKKKPMKKWDKQNGIGGHFTGVRVAEANNRRLAWIMAGSLYRAIKHNNAWIANPLAFWTAEDIARYLDENNIEVIRPDTFNGGSGCVTCMFGCAARAKEGQKNSMQDLKTRNPKMWQTALDDWGYREVLDFLGVPYE